MSYKLQGNETEILVPVPGDRERAEWRRVIDFCWHADDDVDEPAQLIGAWVAGQGLRRASAVLDGR